MGSAVSINSMNFNFTFENELVRCKCGTPMLKKISGKKLEILKHHNGQTIKMTTEYTGDSVTVSCDKCGYHHKFINLDDSFKVDDEVGVIKVPVATG
jgi:hypothetical protein